MWLLEIVLRAGTHGVVVAIVICLAGAGFSAAVAGGAMIAGLLGEYGQQQVRAA
jgi:hypothetical protein